MAVAHVLTSGDASPGATSQATASATPVDGNSYLLWVTQIRQASTNPSDASVTGWSQTWIEVTALDLLWSDSGTNRRRTQCFICQVSGAPGAGVITINYAAASAQLAWGLVDLGVTAPGVVVAGSAKTNAANSSSSLNTLYEPFTMNAVADALNRWVSCVAVNVNATTARLELDADTGGDADWITLGSYGNGSAPTIKMAHGWIDSTADNTPGSLTSSTAQTYRGAVEIDYAVATSAIKNVNGLALADVKAIDTTPIASVKSLIGLT